MSSDNVLRSFGLDRYDRNARLRPALLALLPALVVVAVWLPKVWTLLGTLVGLVVSCGALFLLAQLARQRGRAVERALGNRIGRRHTAVLLSHCDTTLSPATKARYHAYLRRHGLATPTAEEERANLASAEEQYRSAVDWLLEHTRLSAKESLLLDENINYGFRRDLFGIKTVLITPDTHPQ